jgi:hypothetical protein
MRNRFASPAAMASGEATGYSSGINALHDFRLDPKYWRLMSAATHGVGRQSKFFRWVVFPHVVSLGGSVADLVRALHRAVARMGGWVLSSGSVRLGLRGRTATGDPLRPTTS